MTENESVGEIGEMERVEGETESAKEIAADGSELDFT